MLLNLRKTTIYLYIYFYNAYLREHANPKRKGNKYTCSVIIVSRTSGFYFSSPVLSYEKKAFKKLYYMQDTFIDLFFDNVIDL